MGPPHPLHTGLWKDHFFPRAGVGRSGPSLARCDRAATANGRGQKAQALPARAGLKSRPGPFVEAPVGACLEQGLATLFRALQVPRAVQALAQLKRCARRRQEDGRRLEPAPVLHGASTPSCSRSPTGRAGRGRGQRCAPPAPHRPLRARHDPAHPLHRSRTARRPHAPSDPSLAPRPLNPSPRPFVQALATGRRTSSRLDSGAARRRGGGGLGRPGRPEDPAARRRLGGGAGARRAVAEAGAPPPWRGGAGPNICIYIYLRSTLVVF